MDYCDNLENMYLPSLKKAAPCFITKIKHTKMMVKRPNSFRGFQFKTIFEIANSTNLHVYILVFFKYCRDHI